MLKKWAAKRTAKAAAEKHAMDTVKAQIATHRSDLWIEAEMNAKRDGNSVFDAHKALIEDVMSMLLYENFPEVNHHKLTKRLMQDAERGGFFA